jgi:hypothetical protein
VISNLITAVMGIQRALTDLVEGLIELEQGFTKLQVETALNKETIDTIESKLKEVEELLKK